MAKITLIGDIMCEPLLMKAARRSDNTYDFSGVFARVREMFAQADYVIGNLETPLAGEEAGYTGGLFSFNAPDALADAIRDAGISFVATANNHCLDRGLDGMLRTVRVLEEKGLAHGGTYLRREESRKPFVFTAGGRRIALVTCTYGTNYAVNRCGITGEEEELIHLLHSHREPVYKTTGGKRSPVQRAVNLALRPLSPEKRTAVKKALGMTYNTPRADDFLDEATAAPYMAALRRELAQAREQADLVIFYPHVGGQFNIEPGAFTRYTVDQALAEGCDAIVASHPHIVQRAQWRSGVPCFYSIGNFSMSPNSVYLLREHLPEYGLAVHLYVGEKGMERVTFSVLKIVEEKGRMMTVWPADRLAATLDGEALRALERDVAQICRTVTGSAPKDGRVQAEYQLHRDSEGERK